MSAVDWVCKKISLESASEQLSAITIFRQQQPRPQGSLLSFADQKDRGLWERDCVNKCFPASLTHAQTLPPAVLNHQNQLEYLNFYPTRHDEC